MQWEILGVRVQNLNSKRQLKKAQLENVVKKKKKNTSVVDKAERDHAK